MIITIDGPGGAGKSTVARGLAQALGIRFLDTGAMYRAVAWKATRENLQNADGPRLARMIRAMKLDMPADRVLVDGTDITSEIRTAQISEAASVLSAHPEVRAELVRLQREIGRQGSLVTEGRDQGSVVFPHATHKFFLTASDEERARRRHRELQAKGVPADPDEVLRDLQRRDQRDSTRAAAPLRVPDGAVTVDTTNLTIEQVIERLLGYIRK